MKDVWCLAKQTNKHFVRIDTSFRCGKSPNGTHKTRAELCGLYIVVRILRPFMPNQRDFLVQLYSIRGRKVKPIYFPDTRASTIEKSNDAYNSQDDSREGWAHERHLERVTNNMVGWVYAAKRRKTTTESNPVSCVRSGGVGVSRSLVSRVVFGAWRK